jgi:hypothetical protein
MREKLEALLALRLVVDELVGAHERKACEQWIAKRGSWFAARAAYAMQVARFTGEGAKRDAAKTELDFFDEELRGIEAEISRLERAIAEHDAKTGRNSIVQSLAVAAQTAQRSTAAFERRLVSVRALQPLCAMKGYGFDEFIPLVSGLTRAAKEAAINRSTIVLLNEESRILSIDRSVLAKVDEARRRLIRQAEDEKTKARDLRDRLQRHSTGGGSVYLEPATVVLCQKLRQAGMAPRVLCDLVEVANVAWTAAAEGLLGRDREAVFVDRSDIGRDFQGRATRVPRRLVGQFEQARGPRGNAASGDVPVALQNRRCGRACFHRQKVRVRPVGRHDCSIQRAGSRAHERRFVRRRIGPDAPVCVPKTLSELLT